LPLSPRSKPRQPKQPGADRPTAGGALTTALGSLGIVLAGFFLFVWVSRRTSPKGLAPLPAEVVESLGRAPLAGRQQMQLIRVGKKLILLTVTPGEARTLTEITDPAEVDRLAGLCQQRQPGSITTTFRHVLAHCAGERTPPEPLAGTGRLASGRAASRGTRRSRSREDSHD
jgi:flagellar biogenesis protein FliO